MDKSLKQREDQIYTTTRILAIVVVPFLVVAVLILYFFPDQSGRLFAWPIKPPINAMLLGAAYAGGIYFFSVVIVSRRWHTVKAGFLPVTTFAGLLGIATILHWDKFTHGSIAFILWTGLYFSTPFLVFGAWLYNRSQDPGRSTEGEVLIPAAWRIFFGLLALATLPVGMLLFISPGVLISLWPWTMTPLTTRVLAAMFMLPAVLSLEIALDPRWSYARRLLEAQFFSLVLFVIAILRDQADIDHTSLIYQAFLGLILVSISALFVLFLRMRARGQRQRVAPGV